MTTNTTTHLGHLPTPFYYYDAKLLEQTLATATAAARPGNYRIHYALKANANPGILRAICRHGFGADCVSGNEVAHAIRNGIAPSRVVYAGVGKSDREIALALREDIYCLNCESLPELEVIQQIAREQGKIARVALRVIPNVDAHTHRYITTGTEENKFGFTLDTLPRAISYCREASALQLIGLHFHIGSQITDMGAFRALCERVNTIQADLQAQGITFPYLNLGGGLGIDYEHPDLHPIPDFERYFATFREHLRPLPGQEVHFELGRSLVAQCGRLITRVLYVKKGKNKDFVIVDAGMNDLLRPALYQARHHIENLTSNGPLSRYDVVGPICESSDSFGQDILLPATSRGDLIAIRSCGAYGEAMASRYNLRDLIQGYFSDALPISH